MREQQKFRVSGLVGAILLLSGCASVGPDFKTPAAPEVRQYTQQASEQSSHASDAERYGYQELVNGMQVVPNWWMTFGSDKLNTLVAQALQNNPNLAAAKATLQQAEQLYAAQAGSTEYPTVAAKLGASRNKANAAAFGQNGKPVIFNLYNVGVAVNYDLDLFGGNRRALEALAAQSDYQRYELAAARLTVVANVVTTAISQAQLREQVEATQNILEAQQKQLDIAQKRFALGAIARMDLLSLKTQLEQTRAGLPALRNKLDQTNHLLAMLIGQAPGAATLPVFHLKDFSLPNKLPLVVPSELVRQRPDVQASTALLHAATANYDVAVSNLYPHISLSATLGSQALTTGALFGPGSAIWSIAGQLAQPLFNAGLRAGANAAEAKLQAVGANYKQTVLQALRNVADVMRQLQSDAQVLQAQTDADAASQEALDLVRQQYQLGAASYVQLLTAQQQSQQTRINLIAARAARFADTAAFYQAMGGGVLSTSDGDKSDMQIHHVQPEHNAGDDNTTQRSE